MKSCQFIVFLSAWYLINYPSPIPREIWYTKKAAKYARIVLYVKENNGQFHELVSRRITAKVEAHWQHSAKKTMALLSSPHIRREGAAESVADVVGLVDQGPILDREAKEASRRVGNDKHEISIALFAVLHGSPTPLREA